MLAGRRPLGKLRDSGKPGQFAGGAPQTERELTGPPLVGEGEGGLVILHTSHLPGLSPMRMDALCQGRWVFSARGLDHGVWGGCL